MRRRREELGLTRQQLADKLGVSVSAVGNYETGVSAPKEGVLLRLFDALDADPNYLYRGAFRHSLSFSDEERRMVEVYRSLPLTGRQTVHSVLEGLTAMQEAWRLEEGGQVRLFFGRSSRCRARCAGRRCIRKLLAG